MKNCAHSLLPVSLLACILCGCGTLEQRRAPPDSQVVTMQKDKSANAKSSSGADAQVAQHGQAPPEQHATVNLHIFGLSYHPDREGTRVSHLDNELNYGLGLGYKLREDDLRVIYSEAGVFKDSGSNWAKFVGANYMFKLYERWQFGADLMLVQSQTYNFGEPFVASLPHLTYDFEKVKLNAVYIPRYRELNRFSAFAFYITVPLLK